MRGLLQRVGKTDPDAQLALRAIADFDALIAEERPLPELLAAAARWSGAGVLALDAWAARALHCSPDGLTREAPQPVAALLQRYPSIGAAVGDDGSLGSAVEVASGRIGVVLLEPAGREWVELDQVVLERLAAAVAVDAVRTDRRAATAGGAGPGIDQLIDASASEEERATAARRLGLRSGTDHVAVAVRARAGQRISPRVAARLLADDWVRSTAHGSLKGHGSSSGQTPLVGAIGRTGVAVLRADQAAEVDGLHTAWGGVDVSAGMGGPAQLLDLPTSWRQARQALVLVTEPLEGSVLSRWSDLGALALLTEVPREALSSVPDLTVLQRVASGPTGAADVALLEVYCETASLRSAGQAVHLHHSSADYRIKRIERVLGYRLDSPTARTRALLAVKLLRLERSR